MQNEPLQAQLQTAYHLIRAGHKEAAFKILAPICRQYPDNASAWWLLAHALDDNERIRYCLQQVLRIDPRYPRAAEKLARLSAVVPYHPAHPQQPAYPLQRPVYPGNYAHYNNPAMHGDWQQPPPSLYNLMPPSVTVRPVPRSQTTLLYFLSTITFLLVGFSILVGVLLYDVLKDKAPALSEAIVSAVETTNANEARQNTLAAIPSGGVHNSGAPAPATPDPLLFGDTYWAGAGDGITMEYLTVDGRYRRFYKFPVKLHVSGAETQVWVNAVNNAISQIGQVVPITLTANRDDADITLEILHPGHVQRRCVGLSFTRVVGCASIDYLGGITEPVIRGQALIATDTNNPAGTVLHELLHAVGVVVHSPDPNDIMYFEETPNLINRMSQRDLNTLKRLYASPSYAD